ncbi:hypothetical protein ACFQ9J_17865 [Streptomyces sp. NPDC056529]|uniref:hypothetical protein n=1 Tax=Streptomyces sp. NPDC056529 TaxID=3345855 RepID=UPI0036D02808
MEIVVLVVVLVVVPVVKKIVRSIAERNRAEAQAVVIVAQGWADGNRARAKAEVIRAKAGETERAGGPVGQPQSKNKASKRGNRVLHGD